jgi:hypothetical protein
VKVVSPKSFEGWGFSLHPSGPKFTIVCGGCGCAFRHRVPTGVYYPKIPCPACGALNKMELVPADESYKG